jgi:hypothetical protein
VEFLDRPWLEQRLYHLEEEREKRESRTLTKPSATLNRIFEAPANDIKCAGLIVLGEADVCKSMMQLGTFPIHARVPRATEIFMMKWWAWGGKGWTREYLGTYTRVSNTALPEANDVPVTHTNTAAPRVPLWSRQTSPTPSLRRKRPRSVSSATAELVSDESERERS